MTTSDTPTPASLAPALKIDYTLLRSVIQGTNEGLQMTGVEPVPLGASTLCHSTKKVSVMVGMVGRNNGTILVNMSEMAMLFLASKLLFEEQTELSEENVDAVCEIGNMVAGCTKEALVGTDFQVENISVPSLILGASYDVHYTQGIDTATVEFEIPDMSFVHHRDRYFSVTISLLRQVA